MKIILQKKEYLEGPNYKCPYCGEIDIEGGFVEIDGNDALQEVSCLECSKTWTDVYKRSDIREHS